MKNYPIPVFLYAVFAFCHLNIPAFGQANINESLVTQTVIVDPSGAGDYTSLTAAAAYLNANLTANIKVSIAAGTYREGGITLNDRTGVTVIEGSSPGSVVLSGADVWTAWTHDGSGNYSKAWTFDWGLATYDSNFDIQDDLGKRCEIVLHDGTPLLQVADKASLVDGSFAVDEVNDLLWIRLAGGVDDSATGYSVNFTSVANASVALVSAAKMDGINGGLPVLTSGGLQSNTQLKAAFDEDQFSDSERNHTPEVISYFVLGD